MRDVDAQELPSTEGFSFTGFLAKPTDVRAWNIQVRQSPGPTLLLPLNLRQAAAAATLDKGGPVCTSLTPNALATAAALWANPLPPLVW